MVSSPLLFPVHPGSPPATLSQLLPAGQREILPGYHRIYFYR
jgi:hypothetical protein